MGVYSTRVPVTEKPRGRRLYLVDVAALGVGAPLGLAIFLLVGHVAHTNAGPAVIISVLIAAVVAAIAGLSYAEFSAQFPDSRGTASYVFTLCGAGELAASIIAWNLAVDYIAGAAAAARGFRAALDSLLGGVLEKSFREFAPLNNGYYVDFIALVLPLLVAGFLLLASRHYAAPKVIISIITLTAVLFIVVAGAFEADGANWSLESQGTPASGYGGFVPFGVLSMFTGAAVLMHAFVGIDHIAISERKLRDENSWRFLILLLSIFLSMFGVGVIITLVSPFYELDKNAALVVMFSSLGWVEAQWIVCLVGMAVLTLTVSVGVSASARILRSMTEDDLLWSPFGEVRLCGREMTIYTIPALAVTTGLLGAFLQETQLVSVLSMGTLLAFVGVQASVVLYRCRHEGEKSRTTVCSVLVQLIPRRSSEKRRQTSSTSAAATRVALTVFCVCVTAVCALSVHSAFEIRNGKTWAIALLTTCVIISLLAIISIASQPQTSNTAAFKVPLLPLVPCVGILIAIFLMMSLHQQSQAWIRLGVCTAFGLTLYVVRHVWRSKERQTAPVLLTNETSTPQQSERFSLDVEQCTASATSSVASRHTQQSLQDCDTQEVLESAAGVIENNVQPREVDTKTSSSETINTNQTTNFDDEKIELFNDDNSFDDKKWNKIWEYNSNDLFDPDFDNLSLKDETVVAEVHESSQKEDGITDENENVIAPIFEVSKTEAETNIVIVLSDASNQETSSDDGSINSLPAESNIPDPPKQSPSLSPIPPPLPMGNFNNKPLKSPELCHHKPILQDAPPAVELETKILRKPKPPQDDQPPMRSLQEELKTTLRLRNQRKIDEIENTVVNVSEGIEIFGGGKQSRTTSVSSEINNTSFKSAMKAGKFETPEFVNKLNNIIKSQAAMPKSALKRPTSAHNNPRPRHVVLVDNQPPDEEMATRIKQMKGTLEEVLNHRRDLPRKKFSAPPPPIIKEPVMKQRQEPKSLAALGPSSEIQIVSRQ